ncbi:MAG TPA: hypothetical protein VGN17_20785 [Bryobacteraceae bacterium]|jgi:hypothetical protein
MSQDAVRVSVLGSGAILVDGAAATLDEVDVAFQAAKARGAMVYYYREPGPATELPAAAQSVLKLVGANRLAISLSSKADFSDWVDQKGASHPRDETAPAARDLAFAKARKEAASERAIAIVRDLHVLLYPAPPAGSVPEAAVKSVEAMIPRGAIRNVAVIADTSFAREAKKLDVAEIGRVLPFFGILIGLCYIGHAVWVFDADGSTLAAGCREADVLIVDSSVAGRLGKDWGVAAASAMRNANILVMDRATQKFLLLRTAGGTKGKIEFLK